MQFICILMHWKNTLKRTRFKPKRTQNYIRFMYHYHYHYHYQVCVRVAKKKNPIPNRPHIHVLKKIALVNSLTQFFGFSTSLNANYMYACQHFDWNSNRLNKFNFSSIFLTELSVCVSGLSFVLRYSCEAN